MKFFNIEIYFAVIVIAFAAHVNGLALCPAPNVDISPCDCFEDRTGIKPSAIRCFGEQSLDLLLIFDILNANVGPNNRDFNIFYTNNTNIEEIPEIVFRDFTFNKIYFENNRKLSKIDPNSFKGLEQSAKEVHICDTKLNLNSDNYSDITYLDGLKSLELLDFSTTECPPNTLLGNKCKCEEVEESENQDIIQFKSTVISCKQIANSEELKQIFNRLSDNLLTNKRNFFRFELKDSKISELSENLFNKITFSEIVIEYCSQLNSINRNVFQSIKPFVNTLSINGINLNNDSKTIEDIWYAMSSLSNLVRLHLVNVFHEIPDKAFGTVGAQTQRRLKYFGHSGYDTIYSDGARIKRIGRYAFYNLPNIEVINLQNNLIDTIDKYSFANRMSSHKRLSIRLAKNKLNSNSLSIGSLSGSQRPIRLELGQAFIGCNRDITYLEESVFSAFLDKAGNELEMGCTYTMQCDCHMKWLYDAPDVWKLQIKSGLFGDIVMPCEMEGEEGLEEVSLWELPEDYFDCQTDAVHKTDHSFESAVNNSVENDIQEFIDDAIDLVV